MIFIVSLMILVVSARFFTGAAERLGLHFGLSSFVIGVFIGSIGTSLPKLVAGALASLAGTSEIVAGNVLGSCVVNALVIPGAVAGIAPIQVPEYLIRFSLPVFDVASLLF